MKKAVKGWIIGGLVAVSIFGYGFTMNIACAAEQSKPATTQDQTCQTNPMDSKAMINMMTSSDFQQRCLEIMKNPEMRQTMINMMKQPEMQTAMKQMMQQDMSFHQMMIDLVNSVDINMDHGTTTTNTNTTNSMSGMDHSQHHM